MRRFVLFLFLLQAAAVSAQVIGDFRSVATGNWSAIATWEWFNGTSWITPAAAPVTASNVISVRSGHTVTITAVVAGGIDQVVVDAGGTLNTSGAIAQPFANGVGVDLLINGTFGDLSTGSVSFAAGATWQMGANGTLLKTTGSSSNNWQSNYLGGIATIPATANWILRKISAQNPAISTTTPASGSVYPNLTIENNTGTAWTTPAGSSFSGASINATIKGNLDIGGSGSNTVDFQSTNTAALPILVQGNVLIRAGCNFRNFGTGLEVQGDFTATGSMTYDANDSRQLVFSGGNSQTLSGAAALGIYRFVMNKTANGLALNRSITVDFLATFTSGIITPLSGNLFTVAATATVTGASNASFVSGPVRYLGTAAFTFPIGKASSYRSAGISGYTTAPAFWAEDFNNNCNVSCTAVGYAGINGAWTQTITGAEGADANEWYVSCAENGYTAGNCGTGCVPLSPTATGASLHVSASPNTFGDLGAAYDAGGFCGLFACPLTNRRIESPTINCTGQSALSISFSYIENGSGTTDNATLWYFDGTTWSQLADMAKTNLCSGQGVWTAFSMSLPASANNNANVKIGFRWVNNDDGVGTDPSFAVDNVTLGITEYFTAEYFPANPQVTFNNTLAATLGAISSCEYWIIDRAPGSSTSTSVTLSWDAASCNITALTDLLVARFDGATWQDHGNGSTTGSTTAGTIVTSAAVASFSPFTIATIPSTPLPVEWLYVGASCLQQQVTVSWATASEKNNAGFEIQRAIEGNTFVTIGYVAGIGNSSQTHTYSFVDAAVSSGAIYYRLKQIDYNGTVAYSPLATVNTSNCGAEALELNAAFAQDDHLIVRFSGAQGAVTVEVVALDGRLIGREENLPTSGIAVLPMKAAGSGVYIVRISDGFTSQSRMLMR